MIGLEASSFAQTPYGVAIISQTCDIVQQNRPNIVVAKIEKLTGRDAIDSRKGLRPRYVEVPIPDEDMFVDLEYIVTIDKNIITEDMVREPRLNYDDAEQLRDFSLRIGRRFSRFAFPDELYPWLRPLQDSINEKYGRDTSALGRLLHKVTEMRISATSWRQFPLDITLHIIVESGAIPELGSDEPPEVSASFSNWLRRNGNLRRDATEIAKKIEETYNIAEKYHLWLAISEALALQCKPRDKDAHQASVAGAVANIVGQIWTDDQFSLAEYRKSEALDLDHLSPPRPFN